MPIEEKMHGFLVFLFVIATGITAGGLLASIYRLAAREPQTRIETALLYAVMVIAGPVVIIGNSTKSYREKQCSKAAYALVVVLSGYWSFLTGLIILSLCVTLRGA
jgi:hypothetical protein